MKIASFNVENLFDRAKAFNDDTAAAKKVVKLEAELNTIFEQPVYSAADKDRILSIMKETGILKSDNGPYLLLRKIRGKLINRPKSGTGYTIDADGRGDWVGWAELKTAHVNARAVMNTGRVLRDVNADILAVVEAEHRVALKQFSDYVLDQVGGTPYEHVMLIDGNDDRGIDVGLMTRKGYPIGLMRSHIHDVNGEGKAVFSRDCPEYCVHTPDGEKIWVLPNHFKSKFGGNDPVSQAKRTLQAERTAEIYNGLLSEGNQNIVVLGDLNDTPESAPIQALLTSTDLRDISEHPSFNTGSYPGKGTYDAGRDNQKIDYLLLSPALFNRVTAGGIFRKGAWPGARARRWDVYPELEKEIHAASDHHLIWCEII
ncbi:endonuclease/exonuclease/phosphatase family protein [Dyadobacter psychrotolerans]|uniref:Endonuclease/exonuclease/phosphatase family protein n=1 Tax=Dyadobacter psychrotolerans TaxID=2541721 RepID=A0A4R5DCS6_9BACT|nr:endonuclease/exonuclease/phosphatase family protein [Dyadobacter psychrotolerans]TDE10807.1 endonuclease/exonuclease/phosphatase family protein [Dyadobacter psychrotolerans]